jgi:hypothetical protein
MRWCSIATGIATAYRELTAVTLIRNAAAMRSHQGPALVYQLRSEIVGKQVWEQTMFGLRIAVDNPWSSCV